MIQTWYIYLVIVWVITALFFLCISFNSYQMETFSCSNRKASVYRASGQQQGGTGSQQQGGTGGLQQSVTGDQGLAQTMVRSSDHREATGAHRSRIASTSQIGRLTPAGSFYIELAPARVNAVQYIAKNKGLTFAVHTDAYPVMISLHVFSSAARSQEREDLIKSRYLAPFEHWVNMISYGNMFFDMQNIVETVQYEIDPTNFPSTESLFYAMSNMVRSRQERQGDNRHKVHRFIFASFRGVSWTGLAESGGCQQGCTLWINLSGGATSLETILHEFAHNLGLMHAAARSGTNLLDQYGDATSILGGNNRGLVGLNAPQLWRIGFLSPKSPINIDTMSGGARNQVTFNSLDKTNVDAAAVVYSDLIAVFISFRISKSTGEHLANTFKNAVHVHHHIQNPTGPSRYGSVFITHINQSSDRITWISRDNTWGASLTSSSGAMFGLQVNNIDAANGVATVTIIKP